MNRCTLALLLAVLLSSCSPDPEPEPEVAVRVESVALDPRSNSPVLVLGELEGTRRLPIWIGFSEAQSIASVLENQRHPRPNTHDLAKRLIDQLEGNVERIVVTRLSEEIYYALIVVNAQGRVVEIDARPSDAIAIGLRYEAPLFVREAVFERSVEGTTEEKPGREVRSAPAPDEPESNRQVAAPRRRFHNAIAFCPTGESRSAIREWSGADLRHRALTQATQECRGNA
jgi:bifunctional DNase/RNase